MQASMLGVVLPSNSSKDGLLCVRTPEVTARKSEGENQDDASKHASGLGRSKHNYYFLTKQHVRTLLNLLSIAHEKNKIK